MKMISVEVSAYSAQWAIEAQQCGANRIELCSNFLEGGTTPSIGCIKIVRDKLKIKLIVIIRPRGGDFFYSPLEIESMASDIEQIRQIGADGIAIGILNTDNQVDIGLTRQLVDLASPMEVTFHRAFDKVKDPFLALEEIIESGCTRILTSGLKATAIEGTNLIVALNKQSNGRIKILPGSGINHHNIEDLWLSTGLDEYHLSAKRKISHIQEQLNSQVNLNWIGLDEDFRYELDSEELKKVIELTKSFSK